MKQEQAALRDPWTVSSLCELARVFRITADKGHRLNSSEHARLTGVGRAVAAPCMRVDVWSPAPSRVGWPGLPVSFLWPLARFCSFPVLGRARFLFWPDCAYSRATSSISRLVQTSLQIGRQTHSLILLSLKSFAVFMGPSCQIFLSQASL